jgi:hypothetical protein
MTKVTGQATRVWAILLGREPGRGEAWLNAHGLQGSYEEFNGIYVTPLLVKGELGNPQTPQAVKTDLALTLVSYQVGRLQADNYLPASLTWKNGAGSIGTSFKVSLRLYDAQGKLVNALDRAPCGGFYPTTAWKPNEKIVDGYALKLPAGLTAGTYSLSVLLYDPADESPYLQATLGNIEIQGPAGTK